MKTAQLAPWSVRVGLLVQTHTHNVLEDDVSRYKNYLLMDHYGNTQIDSNVDKLYIDVQEERIDFLK